MRRCAYGTATVRQLRATLAQNLPRRLLVEVDKMLSRVEEGSKVLGDVEAESGPKTIIMDGDRASDVAGLAGCLAIEECFRSVSVFLRGL